MEPPVALLAQFAHPLRASGLQLRVIPILPGTSCLFERFDLLEATELLFSGLGQELAPTALANQAVDLAHERFRNDDVGAPSIDN